MFAALICVVNCVPFTNVVANSVPFQRIFVLVTKLEPFTVSVKAGLPANVLVGDRLLSEGTGLVFVTVKLTGVEVPPPGAGLTTITGTLPAVAISAAVICAFTELELTKVVGRALPFHCATELVMKFVPLIVNSKAALPSTACAGERVVMAGTGLGPITVNGIGLDIPPPGAGLNTVTAGVPALTMSLAAILAVS
jgi:hypothetical protein